MLGPGNRDTIDFDHCRGCGICAAECPGEVAERHQPLREGSLVDVAVRAALLGGAGVHVLDAEDASALADGVGALCRFHS